MSKWAFLFAAAALVIIGCGGGGGGTHGTTGTTGNANGDSVAQVGLPNVPGIINTSYLTGQGRVAGSITIVIHRLSYVDSFGSVDTKLVSEKLLQLDGFTHQIIPLDIPTTNSRLFNTFNLEIQELRVDNGDGTFTTVIGLPNQPAIFQPIPADIRAFPARQTSVQVYLDDAIITVGTDSMGNTVPVFDTTLFDQRNLDPDTGKLNGFLGDYVRFDISAVPAKPMLSDGTDAQRVYFTGDSIAISVGGDSGAFEGLTTTAPIEGRFGPKGVVGGQATPGTYTLVQPDPRDLSNTAKITSLLGIWRDVTEVVTGMGTFEVMTFPSSSDDNLQDMVMYRRNGAGAIDALYFGQANFGTGPGRPGQRGHRVGPTAPGGILPGTFNVFPVDQLVTGGVTGELDGTIGTFLDANHSSVTAVNPQLIREGRFAITTGTPPVGFKAAGRFIVFRR